MAELLSAADVDILHDARMRLRQLAQVASHEGWGTDTNKLDAVSLGRLADAFDRAEDAIFHALNIAHSHCDDPMARVAIDRYTEALR